MEWKCEAFTEQGELIISVTFDDYRECKIWIINEMIDMQTRAKFVVTKTQGAENFDA